MIQQSEILTIRITPEIRHYFDVLGEKYHVKRSEFIRDAIIEKMKRDVPAIRERHKKIDCPF
jgi:metal-responsive CopG/Arc/MetJ family transcriptional regulator